MSEGMPTGAWPSRGVLEGMTDSLVVPRAVRWLRLRAGARLCSLKRSVAHPGTLHPGLVYSVKKLAG